MNFVEWFDMGGYAKEVWSAFGISLVVLVTNVLVARGKHGSELVNAKRRAAAAAEEKR